jgi:hypothetical protein
MAPFGALLAGGAAHRFGAPTSVAASGLLCIIAAIFYGRLPAFRDEVMPLILAQQDDAQAEMASFSGKQD